MLAIIIPAYKSQYLKKSLHSLALQTDKNFKVYVGDDSSPFDIRAICEDFNSSINLNYHRFESNLGGVDLVSHWERCVALSNEESWIWIFSDDDIAEPECVESFYKALSDTEQFFDVYRFNTSVIDSNGEFISAAKASPQVEKSIDLAYNILLGKRGNSMPDHIFKKSEYDRLGGVANFIQAQGSDWATSIKFAGKKGLYTISGPRVQWRFSGLNVTSLAHRSKSRLIYGHLQFIEWIVERFRHETYQSDSGVKYEDILKASKINIRNVFDYHYRGIPYLSLYQVSSKISKIYGESIFKSFKFCLSINFNLFKKTLKNRLRRDE